MDPLTVAVTMTQAAGYCSTLLSTLVDIYNVLRNGTKILQEHWSSVNDLILVVTSISENLMTQNSTPLVKTLTALETTGQRLLKLFQGNSRLRISFVLLARREEIDKSFKFLEREKSTLLLYLNTETLVALRGMPSRKCQICRALTCRTAHSECEKQESVIPRPNSSKRLHRRVAPAPVPELEGNNRFIKRNSDRPPSSCDRMQNVALPARDASQVTQPGNTGPDPKQSGAVREAIPDSTKTIGKNFRVHGNKAGERAFQHIARKKADTTPGGDYIIEDNEVDARGYQIIGDNELDKELLKLQIQLAQANNQALELSKSSK